MRKQFGEVAALKGIDLDVASGEFVSLLGPSGCGKTTALRIIAGFDVPTGGRVLIDGKDILGTPANRRDMGMVFQAYSLFPNMTARDNVAFGLKVRRVARAERARRAEDLLDLVGLGDRLGNYPHQLSGGQQQRVALARALAIQPSVLLLDEPLSALDAKVRVQLRDEIRQIQRRLGITTLYVTHDQEEALSVSDRVVVLSQGQIEQVGTPAEIYGEPQTIFVADFIGTMNRIQGQVAADGAIERDGVRLPVAAARSLTPGEPVVVLLRPESIDLVDLDGDTPAHAGSLPAEVISHTFLGPVTRLSLTSSIGSVTADVSSIRALSLAVGSRVGLHWDPAAPRLLRARSSEEVEAAARAASTQLQTTT